MLAGCDLEPMFERQELFPVAQVPLAHQLGPVPGGGQQLGEEELRVGDPANHLLRGVRVPPRVGGLVEPVPQGQPGTSGLISRKQEPQRHPPQNHCHNFCNGEEETCQSEERLWRGSRWRRWCRTGGRGCPLLPS